MTRLLRPFVICLAAAQMFSCAIMKIKSPEIDSVKTVALVGYSGVIDLSHSSDANSSTGFGAMTNAIKGAANAEKIGLRRMDQAESAYGIYWKSLGEATGFAWSDKAQVEGNPAYSALSAAHPLQAGTSQNLGKIVSAEVIERMKPEERTALVKSMGVDAVAYLKVRYVVGGTGGFALGGIGKTSKYLKAVAELKMFDATTPEPIWVERWAEGGNSTVGVVRNMGIDSDENETAAVLEAAQLSAVKLGQLYQEAKDKAAKDSAEKAAKAAEVKK
jgi:hypothetical protein